MRTRLWTRLSAILITTVATFFAGGAWWKY
jgi:hypothetical protein